jgi:HPt (histidine-containing phosphotransfer) domain-containing protein
VTNGVASGEDESADGVLDPAVLAGLRELDGDAQGIGEIVTMFFHDTETRLEQLRQALPGEAPVVRDLSHGLKGSSGMFGARRLSALCAQVEALAADGDMTAASEVLSQLETEFASVRRALAREFSLPEEAAGG